DAVSSNYVSVFDKIMDKLGDLRLLCENIPMLARTHVKPATPTSLGKEIKVFLVRLKEQLERLEYTPIAAKFGGATGNFNAHHVAYPGIDWLEFGNNFVEKTLELKHSFRTTQIEHYDH